MKKIALAALWRLPRPFRRASASRQVSLATRPIAVGVPRRCRDGKALRDRLLKELNRQFRLVQIRIDLRHGQ